MKHDLQVGDGESLRHITGRQDEIEIAAGFLGPALLGVVDEVLSAELLSCQRNALDGLHNFSKKGLD